MRIYLADTGNRLRFSPDLLSETSTYHVLRLTLISNRTADLCSILAPVAGIEPSDMILIDSNATQLKPCVYEKPETYLVSLAVPPDIKPVPPEDEIEEFEEEEEDEEEEDLENEEVVE